MNFDGTWTAGGAYGMKTPGTGHRVDNFDLWRYTERPDVEDALLHELMHQLGVIDLYNLQMDTRHVRLPDANDPDQQAACGRRITGEPCGTATGCLKVP